MKKFLVIFLILISIFFMPTYWGDMLKSATDSELIEAAIARISKLYCSLLAFGTWSMVPKAQDDDETIEEAIDRLIAVHEADPTAHLGEGDSLQSHKAAVIIDHVVGSILADKNTMTELSFRTFFEDISGWGTVGTVNNSDFPGVYLYTEWGAVNESNMSCNPQIPENFRSSAKNILFQIIARFNFSNTHINAWIGLLESYISTSEGFGFVVNDGVVKAQVRAGITTVQSAALSVTLSNDNIFRAQYNATSGNVDFYINGVLVATLAKPTGTWADDVGPNLGVKLLEENDGYLRATDLFASREI